MKSLTFIFFGLLCLAHAEGAVLTGTFDYHFRENPDVPDFAGSYDFTASYTYDSYTNTGIISGFVGNFGGYEGGGDYSFTRLGGSPKSTFELNPFRAGSIAWDLSSTDGISFGRLGRLTDGSVTANLIGISDFAQNSFIPIPLGASVVRGSFDPDSFSVGLGIPEPSSFLLTLIALQTCCFRRAR